eukprot:Nitzschia sp. Nitz4//scaffold108_size72880//36208//37266//NITZ4_005816-RA/size72880-processed-gene-0.53-mRNA-1//-1//CDS//3329532672//203//frame0
MQRLIASFWSSSDGLSLENDAETATTTQGSQPAVQEPKQEQPLHESATIEQESNDPSTLALRKEIAQLNQEADKLRQRLKQLQLKGDETRQRQDHETKALQRFVRFHTTESLPRAELKAKQATGFWEYAQILREEFEKENLPYSWQGWFEAWLLRGIHHAMIMKDQHDIVQKSCNCLLMELYTETMPQLQEDHDEVESELTADIIRAEQANARLQYGYQSVVGVQKQLMERYKTARRVQVRKERSPAAPARKRSDRPERKVRTTIAKQDDETPRAPSRSPASPTRKAGKGILKKQPDRWEEGGKSPVSLPRHPEPRRYPSSTDDSDSMSETGVQPSVALDMPTLVSPGYVDD